MQPFQCDLQPQLQETHRTMHTGTTIVAKHIEGTKRPQPHPPHRHEVPFIAACSHSTRKNTRFRAPASSPKQSPCNIHAAIPMRSATTASRNAKNYAHRNDHCCKTHRRNQTTAAAPAAHTRYLSSLPAATLHGKTQGFVLRLPAQNIAHATFIAAIPMRSATTASRNAYNYAHRNNHCCKTHRRSSKQQLAGRLYQAVCERSDLELRVEARGFSKLHASLAYLMWHPIPASLQVETFATTLLCHLKQHEFQDLKNLDVWHWSLRRRTRSLWFPKRLWYDLIHRANFRCEGAVVKLSLDAVLKRDVHRQA